MENTTKLYMSETKAGDLKKFKRSCTAIHARFCQRKIQVSVATISPLLKLIFHYSSDL